MASKWLFMFLVGLGLAGCAEDAMDVTFQLNISDEALRSFIASNQNGSAGVRFWYYYKGQVLPETDQTANEVRPRDARPERSAANNSIREWSTSETMGTPYSLDQAITVSLEGVPLGKEDTIIAIELLQRFDSDSKIHVVGFFIYNAGTAPLTADKLKADLSEPQTLIAGRTCGDWSKAWDGKNEFHAPLEASKFTAICD